ncbi:hypothetical protein Bca52824_001918 [Brassica carinata]|uniref:2Fe-2S ferredoxin-type domain-containing protein n=1 Tax=Brassica carinata TaxID=52824 RepID=A0A8X7WH00_BRACI|nr:hypothetical protein Bca52824_001918 [Brassica carinata]
MLQTRISQEAFFLNLKNRTFCTCSSTSSSSEKSDEETEKITIIFVDKDGEEIPVKVPNWNGLVTCEASLACSTCHVIVMITIRMSRPELDGLRLAIPSATRNFAVDWFVQKPH